MVMETISHTGICRVEITTGIMTMVTQWAQITEEGVDI